MATTTLDKTAGTTGESQVGPPAAGGRRWLGLSIAIGIYALLSLVPNSTSWLHGGSHWLACGGCGDNGQEVWFLASGAHSLAHLQDPLRTTWLNAPYGVDLADNTSMPLVGMITAPVTWLFGPIAAYNVVFSFAYFSAAVCAMLAARRFVRWMPAAFFAGLLYGFSPYMVGEGYGHLFLMLTFVFPLMLIGLDEVLVRQRRPWWLGGIALGLLTVVQLGISVEMLVDAVFLAGFAVVALVLTCWRQVGPKMAHGLKALALAAVVAGPFVAFYVITSRTGPEHISGSIHNMVQMSGLAANLLGPILPTTSQVINFGHTTWSSSFVALTPPGHAAQPDVTENGSYLGIPLLLLLLGGLVARRRDYVMRYFFLLALFCFVLSLGANLHIGNHVIQTHMPFRFFLHFPLLKDAIASRWSLFVWLFVALMAALTLEACRRRVTSRAHARANSLRLQRFALPAGLVLAAASVVSLLPPWPYHALSNAWIPTWFVSPAEKKVPVGSTLLTYPIPSDGFANPMVWQSVDAFRYRITGGEAGAATVHNAPLENALQACYLQEKLKEPVVSSWSAARAELASYKIQTIVAPPVPPWYNRACAVRFLTKLTGRRPRLESGAYVWSNLKS